MSNIDINNPDIPILKSAAETRQFEFTKVVNKLVVDKLGKAILNLDAIAENEGIGQAFESVGNIIHNAVIAGLEYQAIKIQELEKELKELKEVK